VQLVGRLFADGKRIEIYPAPDKLKKQFSYADKSAATHVIIYGEEELAAGSYKVKELATGRELVVEL
jgi:histidyl-tRNA synthetase